MLGVLGLSIVLLAAQPVGHAPTASALTERIDRVGAKAVLDELWSDDARLQQVLRSISSGDPEWLRIADVLFEVSDAGAADELGYAVAEALRRRPADVLRLNVDTFGLDVLCSAPDMNDERFSTFDAQIAELDRRAGAVRKVDDPVLRERRDACVSYLRVERVYLKTFYGKNLTAATYFPQATELWASDGSGVLRWIDGAAGETRQIVFVKSSQTIPLSRFNGRADVAWSPDSRFVAITDNDGSDAATFHLFDVSSPVREIALALPRIATDILEQNDVAYAELFLWKPAGFIVQVRAFDAHGQEKSVLVRCNTSGTCSMIPGSEK